MTEPAPPLRILALEPFHGGSHRAYLDGCVQHTQHQWTVLGLPARHWKWRMRHAAVTFAGDVQQRVAAGESWDVVFASDMLDLAAFRGLAPESVRQARTIACFHENQLTYPWRERTPDEAARDAHFGFTNITTAIAADEVWFNSAWHRDVFLQAARDWLRRMPDHAPVAAIDDVAAKSAVHPPGVDEMPARPPRELTGPMRLLWAARWEHDKNPELFFAAVRLLRDRGVAFRLNVVGESFAESPRCFADARDEFADCIDRWGYQPTRDDYLRALRESDVVVSTARHEFFGIAVLESVAAGCFPAVPHRLAYPDVLDAPSHPAFFWPDTDDAAVLANHLQALATAHECDSAGVWSRCGGDPETGRQLVARFAWPRVMANAWP